MAAANVIRIRSTPKGHTERILANNVVGVTTDGDGVVVVHMQGGREIRCADAEANVLGLLGEPWANS